MGGMCCVMTTGTGKRAGNLGMISSKAFGPPVDVPMATICGANGDLPAASRTAAADSVGVLTALFGREVTPPAGTGAVASTPAHNDLILGISSSRMRCCATLTLPTFAGLVT
jgi:hypothetical protein